MKSRLPKPFLSVIALCVLMIAAIVWFGAQKAPPAPVPRVLVQAVRVIPKIKEKFGPTELFGPHREEGSEITDLKTASSVHEKPALMEKPQAIPKGTGRIAIVIDDMGVDKRSAEVIAIDAPLTLAFLPYARNLKEQIEKARARGHELMIHVPMEPKANNIDPGPDVLKTSMSEEELKAALERAFASFEGYKGINNHMGSKLTEDKTRMGWVMQELKDKNLFFLDSMTISDSEGFKAAREAGVAYGKRDVFLDHETDIESVRASLRHLEALAYKNGYAIAIGHPKDNTIAAIKEWLPTLKDKKLTLVPVSALLSGPKPSAQSQSPVPPPG